ncbi:MAG: hypothetical protein J2P26_10705, partial [Nocardiopsaceae bacterium]|nr:hypothetical protein [Nocardiopsaceae bacterium]
DQEMSTSEVAGEEWAKRVQRLSAAERDQRLQAVAVLLGQPDDISDGLESELYVLQEQLTAQVG